MRVLARIVMAVTVLLLLSLGAEAVQLGLMESPADYGEPFQPVLYRAPEFCTEGLLQAADTLTPLLMRRAARFELDPSRTQVALSLVVPKEHPCVEALARGGLRYAGEGILEAWFGAVDVNDRTLRQRDLTLDPLVLTPDQPTTRVTLRSAIPSSGFGSVRIRRVPGERWPLLVPATDSLTVHLQDMRFVSIGDVPTHLTDSAAVYAVAEPQVLDFLYLAAEPLSHSPTGSAVPSNRDMVQRIGGLLDLPGASHFLGSLPRLVPLLLLLWLWRALPDQRERGVPLPSTTRLLAAAGLLAITLRSFSLLDHGVEWFSHVSRWVEEVLFDRGVLVRRSPLLGRGFGYAFVITMTCIVPAAVSQATGATFPHRRRYRYPAAVVVALAVAAAAGLAVRTSGDLAPPRGYYVLLILTLGLALCWLSASLLHRMLVGAPMRVPPLLATMGLVVALSAMSRYLPFDNRSALAWVAVTTLVGAMTIRTLARIARFTVETEVNEGAGGGVEAEREASAGPDSGAGGAAARAGTLRWWRGLRILSDWSASWAFLVLLLALPIGPAVRSHEQIRSYFHEDTPTAVEDILVPFAFLIWIVAVLLYLRREGLRGLALSKAVLVCGGVAASSMIYPLGAEWLGIPVTFLIGYAAVRRFLLRPEQPGSSVIDNATQALRDRAKSVHALVNVRLAEGAHQVFRRKKLESLQKGDTDFGEYQLVLRKRQRDLGRTRSRIIAGLAISPEQVLALAPYASAWKNGLHGARWAAFLAAPWIAVGFAELLATPAGWLYPHWTLAYSVVVTLMKWSVFGFVLGYFFPYLPGSSGLRKGMMLGLVSVLPLIPIAAIEHTTTGNWQPVLVWSAQVLFHCLLIGLLAFDHFVLRASGEHDWRLVFAIHKLPALSVSISSIILAVATAVTALVSDQAAALIVSALRFAIPPLVGTAPPGGS